MAKCSECVEKVKEVSVECVVAKCQTKLFSAIAT